MSEVCIVDEDSTYPFKTGGFSEPIRTKSEACQRWFDRGLMQVPIFNPTPLLSIHIVKAWIIIRVLCKTPPSSGNQMLSGFYLLAVVPAGVGLTTNHLCRSSSTHVLLPLATRCMLMDDLCFFIVYTWSSCLLVPCL
jgi:hypothetical protein